MRYRNILLILILLLTNIFSLLSQQSNYPVRVVDGKEYFSYPVQAGEGLYAISKKFNVSQTEINNANAHIHEGLKTGMVLLIPKTTQNISLSNQGNKGENQIHIVEKKQTLFAISRMYDVTVESIIAINPGITSQSLAPGDALYIPSKKTNTTSATKDTKTVSTTSKNDSEQKLTAEQTAKVESGKFLEHTVQIFETLYSIGRKYDVSVNEIKTHNPELNNRQLKAGEKIIIQKKDSITAKKTATSAKSEIVQSPQTHRVEAGETLYSISRKHNISVNQLKALNPDSAEILSVGTILNLYPSTTNTGQTVINENMNKDDRSFFQKISDKITGKGNELSDEDISEMEKEYFTHKVKIFDTLYSIGRKYGVSVYQLKELNPESAEKLRTGTILRIKKRAKKEEAPVIEEKEPPKTIEKKSYKVAYLLPFMTNNLNDQTAYKFIEFYMGSLLALNNAKNGNMKYEVFAYDIEKSDAKLREVLQKPELKTMDFIIGPAYTTQVETLAKFAAIHKIYTLIPFSSKVDAIANNPYLFQFNPDLDVQNEYLASLLNLHFKASQLILIETGNNSNGTGFYSDLKKKLDQQSSAYKRITTAEFDDIVMHLHATKNNIIIFDTESYDVAKNYLSNLQKLSLNFDITTIGQYAWRAEAGAKPKMFYIAPFKGNTKGSNFYENEFKKYFGEQLGGDNPRFDLIGYDLTNHFFSTMLKNGFSFNESSLEVNYNKGVQSDLNFKRHSINAGYINHKMYLIVDDAK